MSFPTRVLRRFSPLSRVSGDRLFRSESIRVDRHFGNRVWLEVSDGSSQETVEIDWRLSDERELYLACTCDFYDRVGPCPHIWAALRFADSSRLRKLLTRMSVIFTDFEEEEGGGVDEAVVRKLDMKNGAEWGTLVFQGQPKLSWQRQLRKVLIQTEVRLALPAPLKSVERAREVYYVLDVASSQENGGLKIHLLQREMRTSGEFGKLKTLSVCRNELATFTPDADGHLLFELLGMSENDEDRYYGFQPAYTKRSQVTLTAKTFDYLLPKLCATGRLLWVLNSEEQDALESGKPVSWDDGPPWRFQLRIDPDDQAQQWCIEGRLVRDGEPPVALKSPPMVLSDGLVLHNDRLARWEADRWEPWLEVLRRTTVIEVPYADRQKFLEQLLQLPAVADADLPANLACFHREVLPRPKLTVHAPLIPNDVRLQADVVFEYEGHPVRASNPAMGVVDGSSEQILVRNRSSETQLLQSLFGLGVRIAEPDGQGHDVWLHRKGFDALAASLIEAGWVVEAEGQQLRKAGAWRLSVVSGVDWFDLEGNCEFEGQSVGLPAILAALKHGEKFVRLGDGSRGMLPQEWLNRFAPLVGLGTVEDDHIRFRPSQAMVLDALLAAQPDASVDEQFAHIRNRLQSFSGITPREAPRGFTGSLRAYQKEGLGWLHFLREFRLGGCLADDMGLGKTIQVLALIQARRMRPKVDGWRAPSLCVVPRSLVFNWIEEAKRFAPAMRVLDYTGPQRQELLPQMDSYDLVVTTYGTLHRDIAALAEHRFDYAILDEAQAIKNAQAQRAKACRLIPADHRLALTGTPVENHLGELWSLFEFLNPGMLGSSSAFQAISGKMGDDPEGLDLLRRAMAPFILRRTKKQVLSELPEKTEQTLYCDLEGKQLQRYREIRDYYRASLGKRIAANGMAQSKIHVLEALLRLRQAACHLGLLDKDQTGESSAKLDALMEQIHEVIDEGHKALVFSQFTSFLSIVRKRLDAEKIVYEYLDGRTRQRQEKVQRFQNDAECPLFLISLKAGGHGLNLTAADYVFILDPWWNPAVEAQAIDRAHRIGQERPVFAYRLIARDTVEEKIIELQQTKRDLADAIISADGSLIRQLSAEDLELLLS